ncbi:glutathione S-transferase family protein [Oceanicoccus sp. KOV_DT_Chl]|uniref:glutathione S-transferase family protein n=1 Tax=Oceanicoccus sp. KOV_DT_Chl TaxID=1904639 RepID=UPI000C7CCA2E|nr:glutathione S-transferase [Oceanicoccus sp. KOV_DT_Chl]
MVTIYHLGVSQSDRVVWLMEELNAPYTIEWYDRGSDGLAPAEYRALHPAGTAPIIKDGDVVLAESAAIVEYLSQRYGNGQLSVAPDQANYPDYLYWMQFSNNALTLFFIHLTVGVFPVEQQAAANVDFLTRREEAYYQHLNQRLGEVDFLAGDTLTCADILAVFNLTTLPLAGARKVDDLPNVVAYLERIQQRPAYSKAMSIAGPGAQKPL